MVPALTGTQRTEAVRACLVDCLQAVGLAVPMPPVVDAATHVTPPMFTNARFLVLSDHQVRLEISQSDHRDPGWDQRYPTLRAYIEFLVRETLGFSSMGQPFPGQREEVAAWMDKKSELRAPYLERMSAFLDSEGFKSIAHACTLD
jgi:hypothetical protein